jgi:Holliday junction resolvase RusA-like endonuclease
MKLEINIDPMGKPRMTQRDKWQPRKVTTKYWKFKDDINILSKEKNIDISDFLICDFYLPMPKSWSKKKKDLMNGKPHKQKPDVDNICKAVMDALLPEDSHIYKIDCEKYWGREGKIVFYTDRSRTNGL